MTEERFNKIIEDIYSNINSQGTAPANEILEYIKGLEKQIKDLSSYHVRHWFSIDDNENQMPTDRDFLIKFDSGQIILFSQRNWPMAIVTHWSEL